MNNIISLIKIKDEHLQTIMEWRTSKDVTRFMLTDPKLTIEKQKRWKEIVTNEGGHFYRLIAFNDKPIGLIGIDKSNQVESNLTWYIGESNYRGKGIAIYVLSAFLKYIFINNHTEKVICDVFAHNEPAIKTYKSIGFVEDTASMHYVTKYHEQQRVLRYVLNNCDEITYCIDNNGVEIEE